jgi:hypothetical protein
MSYSCFWKTLERPTELYVRRQFMAGAEQLEPMGSAEVRTE